METNGQLLRQLRKISGLSQTETGKLCKMNKSQISKLENDKISNQSLYEKAFNALGYRNESKLVKCKFPYTTETILSMLSDFKKERQEYFGIDKLALYGSCSRNEQTEDSDIDIAVQLKTPNLLKLISLENELQELFKIKTDVISLTSKFLPDFKQQISKDMIYV